jgi:hypothetical protein
MVIAATQTQLVPAILKVAAQLLNRVGGIVQQIERASETTFESVAFQATFVFGTTPH